MEIKGKCATAHIHTDNVDGETISQIQSIVNCEAFRGQDVHYMPDVHAGANCTVGFSAGLGEHVNPSHVGGDIGCAVSFMELSAPVPEELYAEFDHKVRNAVPPDIRETSAVDEKDFFRYLTKSFSRMRQKWPERLYGLPQTVNEKWVSGELRRLNMNESIFYKSIGTMGSGNHFIEYGCAENVSYIDLAWWNARQKPKVPGVVYDDMYVGTDPEAYRQNRKFVAGITVHCGSRNFGQKVCRYWESVASRGPAKDEIKTLKARFKEEWKKTHWKDKTGYDEALVAYIATAASEGKIPGYLTGEDMDGYLADMCFAQAYARYNHMTIQRLIGDILAKMSIRTIPEAFCPHNYIDMETRTIHKGSVRALDSDMIVIPFNMRDGVAVCAGKSNAEWNCSAPHGAGRSMSRSKAKKDVPLEDYRETMKGVFSTSVCRETLDESPQAYKPTGEIMELIKETADVLYVLPSKINIKATKRNDAEED